MRIIGVREGNLYYKIDKISELPNDHQYQLLSLRDKGDVLIVRKLAMQMILNDLMKEEEFTEKQVLGYCLIGIEGQFVPIDNIYFMLDNFKEDDSQ